MEASKEQPSNQQNLSSSGIIIGLPGETRQSFFETVEKIMGMGINSFIPYTLMVLKGTPLGDEIYERRNEYVIKNRIVPQQFGRYEGRLVLDTEEVAVGTPTMTHDDYLECRSLCFFPASRIWQRFIPEPYSTSPESTPVVFLSGFSISWQRCERTKGN